MKLIPLGNGIFTKVSDSWFEPLSLIGPWQIDRWGFAA